MGERRRVVVTGIGLVTPVGMDEATFWRNMVEGRSGVRRVRAFDVTEYRSKNGAEVDSSLLAAAFEARKWRSIDRTVDFGLLASAQALEGAGLLNSPEPVPQEMATIVGTAGGPVQSIEESCERFFLRGGMKSVRPTTVVRIMGNAITSHISMKFRLTGANYIVVSACSCGTGTMGIGMRMIRDGYAERVLCGGTESCFSPLIYAAWDRLGVMSAATDPEKACRPFDQDRDGFVMGEGAVMFVLEERGAALARGARIRGEICGYGESSDATHITKPSPEGQAKAMKQALADARMAPADIGFINAHGTATETNDECETQAIHLALGNAANSIPVASNKSFFGHLLGAAGNVEVAATLLGLEAGLVPPNLNLEKPDPACNLRFVPGTAMDISSPVAMKNSFGFGGNNAVLILRRHEG